MTIYSTAKELRTALNKVNPSKIAVAFIGIGWEEFLLPNNLKEIILSPTVGSNPYAIRQVIDHIGIDNVHFLDNLHAKIYVGANSALLGSCNLSRNGFSDAGNFEMGVIFSKEKDLKQLNEIFDNYKVEANKRYPDAESKEERLEELYRQWQVSKESGTDSILVNSGGDITPSILDWVPNKDERIHIVGWFGDLEHNEEVIRTAFPDVDNIDNCIADQLGLLEGDEIELGDWILCYRVKQDGYADGRAHISWLYVHHVISNGAVCKKNRNTMLVWQDKKIECPHEPFVLDKTLIFAALNAPDFRDRFYDVESLAPTELVAEFLEHLKNEAAKTKLA